MCLNTKGKSHFLSPHPFIQTFALANFAKYYEICRWLSIKFIKNYYIQAI